jgi:deoxyribose-phosphate aldolase
MNVSYDVLKKMIDHSLLHPTMTDKELIDGCELAKKYEVASVCIKPYGVRLAKELLSGSDVKVGTVIGFPHGNSVVEVKVYETESACLNGAEEIDMVINIGKALGEDWDYISNEIMEINRIVKKHGAILKVIFENDYLKDEHIIKLCEICNKVKPAFVKTSSGYGFTKQKNGFYSYNGATTENLKLMRKCSDTVVQVKAAGGIRTLEDLLRVHFLGVSRVGATATAVILDEAKVIFNSNRKIEESSCII